MRVFRLILAFIAGLFLVKVVFDGMVAIVFQEYTDPAQAYFSALGDNPFIKEVLLICGALALWATALFWALFCLVTAFITPFWLNHRAYERQAVTRMMKLLQSSDGDEFVRQVALRSATNMNGLSLRAYSAAAQRNARSKKRE